MLTRKDKILYTTFFMVVENIITMKFDIESAIIL